MTPRRRSTSGSTQPQSTMPTSSRFAEGFGTPSRTAEQEERDIESGTATPIGPPPRSSAERLHGPPGNQKEDGRWFTKIGRGMWRDLVARAPYYGSDWRDAWNYRVVPATWFIFFANVFPGIAFSLDLIETTGQYGVQEVLLSSFMAAFFASFFGGQPLLISGVTGMPLPNLRADAPGPITVFNKVIYDIIETRSNPPIYLHFIGWVYLWGAIFHWIVALGNGVSLLRYVTRFSCDTFGFYVAAVYVQYGIQVVERQFGESSTGAAFLGILLAILMLVTPHYFNAVAESGYISRGFRRFCGDYGMPITVVATSGLAYWGYFNGAIREAGMTLPVIEQSFVPANNRPWLVRFWELDAMYVGIACPFGFILFILFYFDANVSSLIAQGTEFPLRKPPGFHWDFFLLGITTFLAGLLGLPAPNGLIPQAPLHTASLVIMGYEDDDRTAVSTPVAGGSGGTGSAVQMAEMEHERFGQSSGEGLKRRLSRGREIQSDIPVKGEILDRRERKEVPVAVVEQRVSNLAQGLLCLILMTKPFQHVLGLIPKGVMAGLFWYMGTAALLTSGVTEKMLYLIRDRRAIPPSDPLNKVRRSRIMIFLIVELIGFGATFAITQTIAAIGFPIIIMLLVPVRMYIVPRLGISKEELDILDGPVASGFTLESVGGSM